MKPRKLDIFLLTSLVLLGIFISIYIYFPQTESGTYVQVRVDGKVIATYPLSENRSEKIETNNGTNTFLIKDACVQITASDCHDHVCEKMNTISNSGETIICLPHKLVLEIITTSENEPTLDGITGGAP